jgi:hypothetical protein
MQVYVMAGPCHYKFISRLAFILIALQVQALGSVLASYVFAGLCIGFLCTSRIMYWLPVYWQTFYKQTLCTGGSMVLQSLALSLTWYIESYKTLDVVM